jgi:hypothetical protein
VINVGGTTAAVFGLSSRADQDTQLAKACRGCRCPNVATTAAGTTALRASGSTGTPRNDGDVTTAGRHRCAKLARRLAPVAAIDTIAWGKLRAGQAIVGLAVTVVVKAIADFSDRRHCRYTHRLAVDALLGADRTQPGLGSAARDSQPCGVVVDKVVTIIVHAVTKLRGTGVNVRGTLFAVLGKAAWSLAIAVVVGVGAVARGQTHTEHRYPLKRKLVAGVRVATVIVGFTRGRTDTRLGAAGGVDAKTRFALRAR